jgi:ribonuclease P protein component
VRRLGNAEDCGYRLAKLKRRADFVRVAAARRSAAAPGLVLQAAQRSGKCRSPSNIRVGYTASRKVGNAVVRNRAKRRLREVAAKVLPDRGKPATDYVLIARESTADRPFPALVADLEAALCRIEHGGVRWRAHIAPDSD